MATESQRMQETLRAAKAQGVLPADAMVPEQESPSWVLLVLSFLGAQLAVWPFLGFLAFTMGEFLEKPTGALIVSLMFLAASIFMLRVPKAGMFFTLLAFNVLLAGIGLWVWALIRFELDRWFFPVLAASLLAIAFLVRVQWVRALLGVAFAVVFAVIHLPGLFASVDDYASSVGISSWLDTSYIYSLWLLCGVWWLWCAYESRWGGAAWVSKTHTFMNGVGIGLLLVVSERLGMFAWSATRLGSADVSDAGTAALFHFNFWSISSCLWVLASGLWLVWNWVYQPWQRQQLGAGEKAGAHGRPSSQEDNYGLVSPERALWLVLYGAWAVLAFVIPNMGVLAVLFTVAWVTGRRRMVVLALLVLLAQLSSFYYALQWPLLHKAGLLMVMGGLLALALGALHLWGRRAAAVHAAQSADTGAPASSRGMVMQRAGLVVALLLALVVTQWDVMKKEQVLAQGQKIYMPLAPRDPRSLMQGDYMALNFDLPAKLVYGDEEAADGRGQSGLDPIQGTALLVASLDAQGIATLQRRYRSGEALAANEVVIPLKYMKGDWVVVTNAYFFPEGQGRVFSNARYGEFRALGKGKVLLAGLADDKLQRIEPSPDAWREDDTSTPQAEDTVTPPDGAGEGVAEPAVPPASETR